MLRKLFEPRSSDDDNPYREKATDVAIRFVNALQARRYAEIWHELVADETKEILAASAFQRHESLATAFKMPVEDVTQDFLSYALANNVENVRTGLWAGIRSSASKNGWLQCNINQAQVAFLNNGAVVFIPGTGVPFVVPLISIPGEIYKVDLETFVVASYILRVEHFVDAAQQATEVGNFQRAIRLLEDAMRLRRAHGILQQHAWQQIFTSARKTELQNDAAFLLRIEPLLVENRELAVLDVAAALQRDEDETLDFKEHMPPTGNNDDRKKLARVFAAFATSGGGKVYFGITNSKQVLGIADAKTDNGRDEFRKRIDNMCRDNISPTMSVRVVFLPYNTSVGSVIVPVAVIKPSSEPIYYADGRPYLRRGQSASPAAPHEVVGIIRNFLVNMGWHPPT